MYFRETIRNQLYVYLCTNRKPISLLQMAGLTQLLIKRLQIPYTFSENQLCSESGTDTSSGRPTRSLKISTHLCPDLLSSDNLHQMLVAVRSDHI